MWLDGWFNREEFDKHGLGDVVISTCRDVCTEGFGLANIADAGSNKVVHSWILSLYTSVCIFGYFLCILVFAFLFTPIEAGASIS